MSYCTRDVQRAESLEGENETTELEMIIYSIWSLTFQQFEFGLFSYDSLSTFFGGGFFLGFFFFFRMIPLWNSAVVVAAVSCCCPGK